jgi:hypothetical protein
MAKTGLYVYHLQPAAAWAKNAERLAATVVDLRLADVPLRQLRIASDRGATEFNDYERLGQNESPGLLPSSAPAAALLARRFLEAARGASAKPVFPSDLRHVGTDRVRRRDNQAPDHWRSLFLIYLAAGTLPPQQIPVAGGTVEVCIGEKGRVIGLRMLWRPVEATEIRDALPAPAIPGILLCYAMPGTVSAPSEGLLPDLVVPYYQTADGRFLPASSVSPPVDDPQPEWALTPRAAVIDRFFFRGHDSGLEAAVSDDAPLRRPWRQTAPLNH